MNKKETNKLLYYYRLFLIETKKIHICLFTKYCIYKKFKNIRTYIFHPKFEFHFLTFEEIGYFNLRLKMSNNHSSPLHDQSKSASSFTNFPAESINTQNPVFNPNHNMTTTASPMNPMGFSTISYQDKSIFGSSNKKRNRSNMSNDGKVEDILSQSKSIHCVFSSINHQ